MARPDIPVVITVTGTEAETDLVAPASITDVILRARSDNVQAIAANISTSSETDPTGTGGSAFGLFPGEWLRVPASTSSLRIKTITYNDDTDLADPVLEVIELY